MFFKITLHEKDNHAFVSGYSDKSVKIASASLIDGTVSTAIKSHLASNKHSTLGICHTFKN